MAVKITAKQVKELRDMTDSPMMECKKALVEAEGDIEKAIDVLRTMGVAKAIKKAGRETNEGTVATFISEDGKSAGMVEVYCETDFVGTNPKFTGFAAEIAQVVAENKPADEEALKACKMGDETVSEAFTELIHIMGENMKFGRFCSLDVENGTFAQYVHLGGKLGVIVEFSFNDAETANNDAFKAFAHDVAMQVAAAGAQAARREDLDPEIVEHEKGIYMEQAAASGKPDFIQEKIATGRLEKFFGETVLTEQKFIKDGDVTIADLAKKVGKECNDTIEIVNFVRYNFGEEA